MKGRKKKKTEKISGRSLTTVLSYRSFEVYLIMFRLETVEQNTLVSKDFSSCHSLIRHLAQTKCWLLSYNIPSDWIMGSGWFFLSISLTDIDLYIYRHTVWIDALRYEKFKGQVLDSMKVTLKMVFSPKLLVKKTQ